MITQSDGGGHGTGSTLNLGGFKLRVQDLARSGQRAEQGKQGQACPQKTI